MPSFAHDLGHGDPGTAYSVLLAADAAGGLMETHPRNAITLAIAWAASLAGFACMHVYPAAIALLFCAGFFELSFSSMTQTLVQMNAPEATRGRVLGLFNMAALGLRAFSGITVGLVGSVVGIHASLFCAAAAFALLMLVARASQPKGKTDHA